MKDGGDGRSCPRQDSQSNIIILESGEKKLLDFITLNVDKLAKARGFFAERARKMRYIRGNKYRIALFDIVVFVFDKEDAFPLVAYADFELLMEMQGRDFLTVGQCHGVADEGRAVAMERRLTR